MNIQKNPNEEKEKIFEIINDSNTINNDSSFNQLLALQLLIQKHSGLKEICKI